MSNLNFSPPTPALPTIVQRAANHLWWAGLLVGVVTAIVGAIGVLQPSATTGLFAIVFVVWLVAVGLISIFSGFGHGLSGSVRVVFLLAGGLSLLLGFVGLRSWIDGGDLTVSASLMAIFIGVVLLMRGVSWLVYSMDSLALPGQGWSLFLALLYMLAGAFIVIVPPSVIGLVWVLGLWLLIMGIVEIVWAFRARGVAHKASSAIDGLADATLK